MRLIGMFDSPFVRRVAVSMNRLGIAFEHTNWSVGADHARIREYSALGRVPTLVLDDGTAGERFTQADVTVTCCWTFLVESVALDAGRYTRLASLATRCEALPEFAATRVPWSAPRS